VIVAFVYLYKVRLEMKALHRGQEKSLSP